MNIDYSVEERNLGEKLAEKILQENLEVSIDVIKALRGCYHGGRKVIDYLWKYARELEREDRRTLKGMIDKLKAIERYREIRITYPWPPNPIHSGYQDSIE